MPSALIQNVHVTPLQAWLIFAMILAVLIFLAVKRLPWLGLACALMTVFAGSRVWAARALTMDEELIIYSIPRRSVCGFWQGATAHIVTVDSLALTETERTYRIVPGIIQREARQVEYHPGWRAASVPTAQPAPHVTVAVWRGLRLAFVSGPVDEAQAATPVDVLVLRRNAWVKTKELAQVFGKKARVVFDSSCKSWYVTRQDSLLQAAGFQTHDVTSQGAFVIRPRPLVGPPGALVETE